VTVVDPKSLGIITLSVFYVGLTACSAPPASNNDLQEIPGVTVRPDQEAIILRTGDYGIYDKQGTRLDGWRIEPECVRPVFGCRATIYSDVLGVTLDATQRRNNDWSAQVEGRLPICYQGRMGEGKLIFTWNGDTAEGTATKVDEGGCEGGPPGTNVTHFEMRPE
jgi:hypothetical protein